MKSKSFLLPLSALTLLVFLVVSDVSATVITFDDMTSTIVSNGVPILQTDAVITNGYQGLSWANLHTLNAPLDAKKFGTNGYYYGMVTVSNVAVNDFGNPAEVDSSGTNFNFLSAYLTGPWNSNLSIEVQGYGGITSLYDTTIVVSATSPTLFTFNYLGIDRLTFNSFGGQNAGFPPPGGGGTQFAMDNFTFEFVPEPSSFLLAAAGALLLCPLLKRKRVA
ncbi:MAG TPA: PEP-CTERM sorting domain-containing protein [Verrucomicrobiae bacterium]|nr:PEP-CTERM sorting domain-containing protein [Verrucomicrobiae bacterium]